MKGPLYRRLAQLLVAIDNCQRNGNDEWLRRHTDAMRALVREHMPSGSGFDNGTKLDPARSSGEKLVFETSFHHMNESGSYDGWTHHEVFVTPSLGFEFKLRVTGRNRNEIKDLIAESFHVALSREVVG